MIPILRSQTRAVVATTCGSTASSVAKSNRPEKARVSISASVAGATSASVSYKKSPTSAIRMVIFWLAALTAGWRSRRDASSPKRVDPGALAAKLSKNRKQSSVWSQRLHANKRQRRSTNACMTQSLIVRRWFIEDLRSVRSAKRLRRRLKFALWLRVRSTLLDLW